MCFNFISTILIDNVNIVIINILTVSKPISKPISKIYIIILMVSFVKEFESYILSENKEESLITIVPGSEAELYLQILNKLKMISTEFPKEVLI